ncbi:hypothetical protein GOEFS_079_00090 [Gordonia effusa NBRC 100432]|uniref:Uncharacterized protein n=1 Tax=Gordonia effusa NBRC 100432 TaxID=1077974 RepID=H0R2I0_9ACTN|nr:hypothetical protein [Gordonia effusa]GAB19281.1 hypothetical protein GOEFS_079_00090 [Gordonia effusa NBRC 100432]
MANRADTAWDAFFDYFEAYDGTPTQIAERFNDGAGAPIVTSAQVRDWRRRHSRPQLSQLPELSYHWAGDPLYFARLLGAIPEDGIESELYAQKRILELRGELRDLEKQVRASDTTAATGRIVAAATASGRWAVAVHPAVEGPTDVPIHVADRLDFRYLSDHLSDLTTLREALEADLGDAFSQNHVVFAPRGHTVWSPKNTESESSPSSASVALSLRYSVAHTVSPFGPTRTWDHVGVRSVAVVSLTLGTWPFDVAALVARMLGYGFVNTRGLSQWRRPTGGLPANEDLWRYRADAHQDLLASPWHRYVWGHVGAWNQDASALLPTGHHSPHVKLIWLRESDDLIDGLALGAEQNRDCTAAEYRDRVRAGHTRILSAITDGLPVHQIDCDSADAGADGLRTPRWDRTFTIAVQVISHLLATDAVLHSALTRSVQRLADSVRPDPINLAIVEWLAVNGHLGAWGIEDPRPYH